MTEFSPPARSPPLKKTKKEDEDTIPDALETLPDEELEDMGLLKNLGDAFGACDDWAEGDDYLKEDVGLGGGTQDDPYGGCEEEGSQNVDGAKDEGQNVDESPKDLVGDEDANLEKGGSPKDLVGDEDVSNLAEK
eukprot:558878-Karenia_brevis.AAC.2